MSISIQSYELIIQFQAYYPIADLDRSLGLQEVDAPGISRKSAHEGGKVVNPTPRRYLVLISVRG